MPLQALSQVSIVIAGTGGKGVLVAGKLLAEAAMMRYQHVAYSDSYEAVMRGGECECTVALSDGVISSPIVLNPDLMVIMDASVLQAFSKRVRPGGTVLVDSAVIGGKVERADIKVFYVPATKIAADIGSAQVASLVLVGALVQATGILPLPLVQQAVEHVMKGKRTERLAPLNKKALEKGAEFIASYPGASQGTK